MDDSSIAMIPTWAVIGRAPPQPTPEQTLARELGRPPWPMASISARQVARTWAETLEADVVCLVFDPEFWFGPACWRAWFRALADDGTQATINVPIGNQNPAWREDRHIQPYLTVAGLEAAAAANGGEPRWMMDPCATRETFCVAALPTHTLRQLPHDLTLGELPDHWVAQGTPVRVFCNGWLHAFNALRQAQRREDLLALCDWHGRVLELGCAHGLMAQTCKNQGNAVTWIGIDLDTWALGEARQSLDLAMVADIERALPFADRIRFDRIVCADVLEHVPYPQELLGRLRRLISEDGLLIAAFPNIGHWSIVDDLLQGRFDEAPSGILCVSHLRFGTRHSWEGWLSRSGWEVLRWDAEKVPLPAHRRDHYPTRIGARPVDFESLETFRFRIVAQPTMTGQGC